MSNELFLVEFSGDFPELGKYELESLFETFGYSFENLGEIGGKFSLIKTSKIAIDLVSFRAAYIKSFWRLLDLDRFIDYFESLKQFYGVKLYYKVLFSNKRSEVLEIYRELINRINFNFSKSSSLIGEKRFDVIGFENEIFVGELIQTARKSLFSRDPRFRRYSPALTMDPYLSRALVNFSRIRAGEVFLEPFAGSGAIAIEAALVGAYVIALDKSKKHILGFLYNIQEYNLDIDLIVGDATNLPLIDKSVDGIATDPPYGRSASTFKIVLEELYRRFLIEASRVLKVGKRIVFCSPGGLEEFVKKNLNENGFKLNKVLDVRVHKSLVRKIYIATLS